jgi:quinol monooxygenase YgiN
MYCVTVVFTVQPGKANAFLARMRRQADESLEREPGCKQFDVWTDSVRPDEVFLYETYDDRAAFDIHLASPHFLDFDREVAPMIAAKSVITWEQKQ